MSIEIFLDAYGNCRRVGTLRRHAGRSRERVTYEHDADWLKSVDAFQFEGDMLIEDFGDVFAYHDAGAPGERSPTRATDPLRVQY